MKKDLEFYKKNAEEDYLTTPISVLRYIGMVERRVNILGLIIITLFTILLAGAVLILNK